MTRVWTGLAMAVVWITMILVVPERLLIAVMALAMLIMVREYVRLARRWAPMIGFPSTAVLVLAVAWTVAALLAGAGPLTHAPLPAEVGPFVLLLLCALGLGAGLHALFSATPVADSLPAMGAVTFGALYLGVPLGALVELLRWSPWMVLLVVAVVAFGDIAALYVGRSFGRRRLASVVSPNKTWEGSLANLAAGVMVTVAFGLWRSGAIEPELLAVGALASVAGQLGDLVESMLKRGAGVKDSGAVLPGHGGLLDRLDSLLFAAPVLLLGFYFLGLEPLR